MKVRALGRALGGGCVSLAFCACPAVAQVPSYATAPPETIRGTIAAIPGKYQIVIADERGFTDSITLRDATVIEPSGTQLLIGDEVTISGHTDGATFDADEIDTNPPDDAAAEAGGPPIASNLVGADVVPPYVLPLGGGAYYYGGACCLGASGGSGFGYLTVIPLLQGHPGGGHSPVGGAAPRLPVEPRRAPVVGPAHIVAPPAYSHAAAPAASTGSHAVPAPATLGRR